MSVQAAEEERHISLRTKFKREYKNWRLRRRRRGAQTRKKASGRKLTIALVIILIGLFGGWFWAQSYLKPDISGQELSLDQVFALAKEKRVVEATYLEEDNQFVGTYTAEPVVEVEKPKEDKKKDDAKGQAGDGEDADAQGSSDSGAANADAKDKPGAKKDDPKKEPEKPESVAPEGAGEFFLAIPESDVVSAQLISAFTQGGAHVTIDPQTTKDIVNKLSTYLLPLLILAAFFGLLFAGGRGGGGGIGDVMTFGTVGKARRSKKSTGITTFHDVAGADEAVAELSEVVDYLKDPDRYQEIGAVPPKGVLLFGPPGCGKTLLSRAVAGEAGVPFFSVAGAEFVESLVGVGAARVRDLFARVRAVAPAIVFIDELDAAGRRRGHGGGSGGSDEREQTLNQLLVEMDGFEVSAGIVVIGATNRPDILDPALLRPGRFDRHITVDQPDVHGRELILKLHAEGKPLGSEVDFELIAKRTPGFSGADLANVINESALLSLRERRHELTMPDLLEAVQRVLHGPKRKGRVLLEDERQRASFHESGHAVVAAAVGRGEDVHRVSILQRGRGIGVTGIQRDSDQSIFTRSQIYAQLVTAMGGLAAEEVIYGEPSTGAERDLEEATELARDIVGRYGFSPVIGRIRLLASDTEQFLTNDSGISELASGTHEAMDEEIKRLLHAAESEAIKLVEAHRDKLEKLAARLLEDETVEGLELIKMMKLIEPEGTESLHAPFARPQGNGSVRLNRGASLGSKRGAGSDDS